MLLTVSLVFFKIFTENFYLTINTGIFTKNFFELTCTLLAVLRDLVPLYFFMHTHPGFGHMHALPSFGTLQDVRFRLTFDSFPGILTSLIPKLENSLLHWGHKGLGVLIPAVVCQTIFTQRFSTAIDLLWIFGDRLANQTEKIFWNYWVNKLVVITV